MTLRVRQLDELERYRLSDIERLFRPGAPELEVWRFPWLTEYRSEAMAERVAHRAHIILLSHRGKKPPEIAVELGIGIKMVRHWIKQFNEGGFTALADAERSGRPLIHGYYSRKAYDIIDETRLIPPPELGLPFPHWSPNRLSRYLRKVYNIEASSEWLASAFRFQDYAEE